MGNNKEVFFEANPNPMWIYEPASLQIIAVNTAAIDLYGYSQQEMLSLSINDLRPKSEIAKLQEEVEKARDGLNNSGIWLHKKKNDELIYVQVLSYPITWENKECKLVVGQDVSKQKDVEDDLKVAEKKLQALYKKEKNKRHRIENINNRLKLLEEVSNIFAEEPTQFKTALKKVAKLLVEEVADVCSFDINRGQTLNRVAQEIIAPEKQKIAQKIRKKYPEWFYNLDVLNNVIESGQPILKKDFSDQDLEDLVQDQEQFDLVQQLGIRSYFILPLKAKDKILGTVTLIILQDSRQFQEDDVSFLTELADKTALHVENSMINKELLKFNQQLEKKVKERTRQLENTNEELESFSYSVSHDLRTPLRAIDGYTSLLIDDYYEKMDEDGQEFLSIINEETKRMGELIDDLLSFSRLSRKEKGGYLFSMGSLVNQCITEIEQAYPDKHPKIEVKELPEIVGDPQLLQRVWINLLSNAIKYQPEGQTACIEIGNLQNGEKDHTTFYIQDNGVGFKMKYADKLFGVFQRLHSNDEFEGTGIGLALVRRIVNRHGGDVWVESELGTGSTFYFSLPNNNNINN